MARTPHTTIRLNEKDRQAIEAIAKNLDQKGVLGLFSNDGTVNVTAVIRYTLQQQYMEVKREENEAKKSQSGSSEES